MKPLAISLSFFWAKQRFPPQFLFSPSFAASTTHTTTTSTTHTTTASTTNYKPTRKPLVGILVGVVVAIVVALAIIMAVIFLVKKKNRRAASHSDPTPSAPYTVAVTQRLQFPPPGMQNGPPPLVSTVPPGSFFSMNVECGAYPPPHMEWQL